MIRFNLIGSWSRRRSFAREALVAQSSAFAAPGLTKEVEDGRALTPKFDADGLVTCVATDMQSGEVLMVAHMNAQALAQTIATGDAWYYSRSRKKLWRKGEESGHTQRVVEMRIDCDQDAVWIKVEQHGPGACHTGIFRCMAEPTTRVAILTVSDAGARGERQDTSGDAIAEWIKGRRYQLAARDLVPDDSQSDRAVPESLNLGS